MSYLPVTTAHWIRTAVLGLTASLLVTHSQASAAPPIVVDGVFDDWREVSPAVDDSGDAAEAEIDLGVIAVQLDREHVYFMVEFQHERNVQALDGSLQILMDADGKPDTGEKRHNLPGVDLVVGFTPRTPTPSPGVGIAFLTLSASDPRRHPHHSDIGFALAPTFATRRIECRIDRSPAAPLDPVLFQGASFSMKWVVTDPAGRMTDETEVIRYPLPSAPPMAAISPKPMRIPSKPAAAMRVMSWNVRFGAILTQPEQSARILRALDPDILLLQEMTEDNSAAALEAFLNSSAPRRGTAWQVVFGEGGGRLRCAIASRFPVKPVAALASVPYPDWPEGQTRTVGGTVTAGNKRVLVAPIHLRCCGRTGSPEDKTRHLQAKLLNQAIREAIADEPFDAVVIGGDLNLVGSYAPIERLGVGLDLDQTDLGILDPYCLNHRNNATWADSRSPFAPGRLDYLLVSDSSVRQAQSFVFNSADLPKRELSRHQLAASDSSEVSDHFPIVADLIWIP
jgi:endonuclease/exonuclease/phosphatase family metal-dependent hydrolase